MDCLIKDSIDLHFDYYQPKGYIYVVFLFQKGSNLI